MNVYVFFLAIEAYKRASTLAPSDPTPLSNLSAATFEAGDYEKSLKYSTEAMALLKDEADDDPRKQKLRVRLTKVERYLSEPDEYISQASLQNAILQLPRYRPHMNADRGYFPVGHDVPESQYTQTLRRTTKDAAFVSFLFCGIGDARNMLETMNVYAIDGPKATTQRLHFTILDHKPAILARDFILFSLLDDISRSLGSPLSAMHSFSNAQRTHLTETLSVLSYLFVAQIMPAYVWDQLQATIQRLLASFSNHEQPISWVHIPVAVQDAVRPTLESWTSVPTGPYSVQRLRQLTSYDNMQQRMARASMAGAFSGQEPLSHLKFDNRTYEDFSIVLPSDSLLNIHDPDLAAIVRDYRRQDNNAKARLSAHIDSKWRSNITLVDIEFEKANLVPGRPPTPDMSFTPFLVVNLLLTACVGDLQADNSTDPLLSQAEVFFKRTVDTITKLRNRMVVEVCLGEMADVLERIQYQAFDRSDKSNSENGLAMSKWPNKYDVIHMSNIP